MEKETYAQAHTDSFLFKDQCGHHSNLQLISASTNLYHEHTHCSMDHILHVTKSCSVKFDLLVQNRFVWEEFLTEAYGSSPLRVQCAVV